MERLGAAGRHAYHLLVLPDYPMALAYVAFLTLTIGCLLNVFAPRRSILNIALVFPLVAMLSDWTENVMSLSVIATFPDEASTLVYIGSTMTILKWSFLVLSFASVVAFTIIAGAKSIRARSTP